MGAHVWGPDYMRHHLLPNLRITGWAPDWYSGFPAYHFYFPLPSLMIVAPRLPPALRRRLQADHRARPGHPPAVRLRLRPAGRHALPGPGDAGPGHPAVPLRPGLHHLRRQHPVHPGRRVLLLHQPVVRPALPGRGGPGPRHRPQPGPGRGPARPHRPEPPAAHRLRGGRGASSSACCARAGPGSSSCSGIIGGGRRSSPPSGRSRSGCAWSTPTTWAGRRSPSTARTCSPRTRPGCGWCWPRRARCSRWPCAAGWGCSSSGMAAITGSLFVLAPAGRLWNARVLPFWFLSLYLLAGVAVAEIGPALGRILAADPDRDTAAPSPGLAVTPDRRRPGGVDVRRPAPRACCPSWLPKPATTDASYIDDWAKWNYSGYERKAAYPEYKQRHRHDGPRRPHQRLRPHPLGVRLHPRPLRHARWP